MFADIKLTVLGPTTVKVDWQSRQDAASYRIVRNGIAIGEVPRHAPPLAFVDDGLTPGGTGTYTVQALAAPVATPTVTSPRLKRDGISSGAVIAKETILEVSRAMSATTPALLPPVDLTAKAVSFTAVRVTWTPPRWATGNYQLFRDRQPLKQVNGSAADDVNVPTGTHIYAVQSMFAKADGTPLIGPVSQEVSVNVGPKLCMPGTIRQCDYMGSTGTSHCANGEQVCNAMGDAFGACQDPKFQCGTWDVITFKECAETSLAKHVGVLRDIPSGDNPEAYVMRHPATVNGVVMTARGYSRDIWGNHWGSFAVGTSQCFVYNFNFWQTCTSPVSGSKLYQDPNTGRTLREASGGVCLGECVGSNERKVYNVEPTWGTEPFMPGSILGGGSQRPPEWDQSRDSSNPFPATAPWGQGGDIKRCETVSPGVTVFKW